MTIEQIEAALRLFHHLGWSAAGCAIGMFWGSYIGRREMLQDLGLTWTDFRKVCEFARALREKI